MQGVLAICPCCATLFVLSEGRFVFPRHKPRASQYAELVKLERSVAISEECVVLDEERFEERLERRRQVLVEEGRNLAKRKLKRIDPTFSAKGVDPQDVKAVFDPIEYVVFHGLTSGRVSSIEFLSRRPRSRRQEDITDSISATVQRGNIEFEVLRMKNDGSFEIHTAS